MLRLCIFEIPCQFFPQYFLKAYPESESFQIQNHYKPNIPSDTFQQPDVRDNRQSLDRRYF